jgi:hypothetical protein
MIFVYLIAFVKPLTVRLDHITTAPNGEGVGVLFYLERKKLSIKCEEGRRPFLIVCEQIFLLGKRDSIFFSSSKTFQARYYEVMSNQDVFCFAWRIKIV